MYRNRSDRTAHCVLGLAGIAFAAGFCWLLRSEMNWQMACVQAAQRSASEPQQQSAPPTGSQTHLLIDYPENGAIFPPEIIPPTFHWHDPSAAHAWRIRVVFTDGSAPMEFQSAGEPMRLGEIDLRTVSSTNRPPELTAEQASTHTWKPAAEAWSAIKTHTRGRPARVAIDGVDAQGRTISQGQVRIETSTDAVGAPIFYRDVPLMPTEGKKGIVQPIATSNLPLINWRLRDIGQEQSRVVMHDQHTCANCHSFSADGSTMGIDVDGPGNDKGLYAIVPVRRQMEIRTENIVRWNADLSVGDARVGFMSQVSPNGRYVLSTFAGKDQSIPSSYFVANFKDYRFLQVFYPTRGILAFYDRQTGRRQPLPGADDPASVQTDGVWSPDGKWIVFARATARDPDPDDRIYPEQANDPHEPQIRYNLYRVPFNDGRGGKAEPIAGASQNGMSNSFPKISPDGRWIVFVQARNGQLMRPDSQLFIVPFAGGAARRMSANTSRMNSWHSFSPNGRWLVFSSKSRSPYTQMFLTHIDANGQDSPPIYIENSTASNRAVNIPEFVPVAPDGIESIATPATEVYRAIDEAMDRMANKDYAGALQKWQQALAIDPREARANNGMGIALGFLSRTREAGEYFQKAADVEPNFFEAAYNLATLLSHEQRLDESVEAWRKVIRIRPGFPEGYERLGYDLYLTGQWKASLDALRSALAADPNRIFALNLAALLEAASPDDALRNAAEAMRLARHALEVSAGKNLPVADALAAALAESGDYDQAVRIEQQAIAVAAKLNDDELNTVLKAHLVRFEARQPLRLPRDRAVF